MPLTINLNTFVAGNEYLHAFRRIKKLKARCKSLFFFIIFVSDYQQRKSTSSGCTPHHFRNEKQQ